MSQKYQFVSQFDDSQNINHVNAVNHIERNIYFSQVCSFPHPQSKKHQLRRFRINESNEFTDINYFLLTPEQFAKFISTKKKHEYKCYPVYDLSIIEYPNLSDVLLTKSDILSKNYNYTGFAPFK
jgi:hypothetical protein